MDTTVNSDNAALQTAVGAFQCRWNAANPDHRLPTDGVLDPDTWAALACVATPPPRPPSSRPPEAENFLHQPWTPIVGWGPSEYVQLRLRHNISTDVIDGQLQFKPTTYGTFVQEQLASVGQSPLSRGQFSVQVELVQDILINIGVMPNVDHDGWFGPLTERSVVQFQTAHDLPATGVVDAQTKDALVAAATVERAVTTAATIDELDPGLRDLAGSLNITSLTPDWRQALIDAAVDAAIGDPQPPSSPHTPI